jgi:hypothetical protein
MMSVALILDIDIVTTGSSEWLRRLMRQPTESRVLRETGFFSMVCVCVFASSETFACEEATTATSLSTEAWSPASASVFNTAVARFYKPNETMLVSTPLTLLKWLVGKLKCVHTESRILREPGFC